jgi:hypothetical protein
MASKNPFTPPVNSLVVNKDDPFYKRYWTMFLRWLFSLAAQTTPESYKEHTAVGTTSALDAMFALIHDFETSESEGAGNAVVPTPERLTVGGIIAKAQSIVQTKRELALAQKREAKGIMSAAHENRNAAINAANEVFGQQELIADGITDKADALNAAAAAADVALLTIRGKKV